MDIDFAHLHVASSFSMRYGASPPEVLVARAGELGQPALALTDRDGAYGAVRFMRACQEAGVSPVLGADLALAPHEGYAVGPADPGHHPGRAQPVKGGVTVQDHHPRVTVLARGQDGGVAPAAGWSRICRLLTHTHLAGTRGQPLTSTTLLARAAAPVDGVAPVVVLLGPDSDVGRAVLLGHRDRARGLLHRWLQVLPADALRVEVVCHGGPAHTPASLPHAARLWALALEHDVPAVLSAAVRHATVPEARVVDVLDAARRMVPLDERHLDRVSTAGHLADTPTMV
ncbi:MAG: PHP domain-containing protein, partial [Actinobacteria bacterium]|nr:PHP domain-containing protein [Actinomycetota bacterium]